MSSDVYVITLEDSGGVRRVSTSKVSTSGTQPLPRAYASLVLMTSGLASHFLHAHAYPPQQPHHVHKHWHAAIPNHCESHCARPSSSLGRRFHCMRSLAGYEPYRLQLDL